MLDKALKPEASKPSRTICIIGAGVSGLVTAKVMLERGHEVTVLEKSGDIGGVWEPSRSYPGVKTQTPRDLYCFTDFPMPADYPEWPGGAQVHAYLDAYAKRSGLRSRIQFNTAVQTISRAAGESWTVTYQGADGVTTSQTFDFVIVATGQFSLPRRLDIPGEAAFTAAGGLVQHSSEHVDASVVKGLDLVVVGFSKSATDIAVNAVTEGARSVTLVHRELAWKIPYFFGGLVNFKNILYCRASEAMFMPWAPSRLGRIVRKLSAPLIWANWRALESLLDMQFGLTKLGLRPSEPIEETIHCSTSIETPGFYKAIKEGRIKTIRGHVTSYAPGEVLIDGSKTVKAGAVVLATGWHQEFPFLDSATRAKLVASDGQYQLHHMMVNPDLPGLGFAGYNSSFATTLSSELGAHWLARYIEGSLARVPTAATMCAGIANQLKWKREQRKVALGYGGLCAAPFHFFHFDELMRDIGARRKGGNILATYFAPVSPKAYGKLLATAPEAAVPASHSTPVKEPAA